MLKCGFPLGLAPDRLPRFRAGFRRTQSIRKKGVEALSRLKLVFTASSHQR